MGGSAKVKGAGRSLSRCGDAVVLALRRPWPPCIIERWRVFVLGEGRQACAHKIVRVREFSYMLCTFSVRGEGAQGRWGDMPLMLGSLTYSQLASIMLTLGMVWQRGKWKGILELG